MEQLPYVILCMVAIMVRHSQTLLSFLTGGAVVNYSFNYVLKYLLRHPRPHGAKLSNYTGAHQFGMPSGHAQTAMYATAFAWTVGVSPKMVGVFAFLSYLSMAQRYISFHHSGLQILVGAIVGSGLGVLIATSSKVYLENKQQTTNNK